MNKRRGFTLAEVLVYLGVSSVVLAVATSLFISSSKIVRVTQAQNELKTESSVLVRRLESSLRSGTQESTHVSTDGELVAIQTIVGADSAGQPIWDSEVSIYAFLSDRGVTFFKHAVLQTPKIWSDSELRDVVEQARLNEELQAISPHVTSFEASQANPNSVEIALSLTQRVNSDRSVVKKTEAFVDLVSETGI